ncbi:DMT family transporter [Streptomyces paludis]|uniref:DMT family transporter n=1 Tax=Streptomyces paludis TaxID=2282738 RepID=UPI0015F2D055|nr:DMT family transporter [Streptomyces paludis]
MSALALSVLLSLVSAIAYASGAILQERVAAATPDRPYAPLHHAVWWAAVSLNGLGALLHVVALAYGPLSLVQPLGALTIVFALPLAALFVGRRAGRTAWRGALLTTAGLAGLLALTGDTDDHVVSGGERLTLAAVTFGAVGLLFLVAQLVGRPAVRSLLLAGAAGAAFGIGSVFTKAVAVDWAADRPALGLPSLAVIGVLAVAGTLLSQASYRGAGLAAPLATVTVINPVVAAVVGVTLFDEGFRYGLLGAVLAVGTGAVTAAGLVLLTVERPVRAGSGRTAGGVRTAVRGAVPAPRGRRARARSEADAAGPQVGDGVDVGSVAGSRAHLEVEMRARAVAGGS